MPTTSHHDRLLAVSLLLVALLAIYGLIARPLMNRYQYYQSQMESLLDRLQRFERMLGSRQDLEAQIQHIRQDNSFDDYYLKPQSPTLAATDMQQQMKSVVDANAGQVVSTQVLATTQEGNFTRVGINVHLIGDTKVLQKVIYALETMRPWLFIDNLQVRARAIRQRGRDNQLESSVQLAIQFDLFGYLRGEGG